VSQFEPVASVADLPEGELLGVTTAAGDAVCLYNSGGRIGALHDCCTHAAFLLSDGVLHADGTLECAWHGARFNCQSGAVLKGPATEPVPQYETRIEGGQILVGPRRPVSVDAASAGARGPASEAAS
jgi:nitrite reductase/ring-hydroxylating ferredoxin subunit